MDGVRYFLYKFEHRMSAETKLEYCDRVKTKLGCEIHFTGDDEYKSIPKRVDLVTRGGDAVSVAEGTKQALERASEAGSNPECTESLDTSRMKCLFGIITSNTERLQPLLDDIATLASVSVEVFANVAPERSDVVVAMIEAAFSMRNISGLVIRPQDPVVRFVLESCVAEENSSNEFPLHSAQSRTVLQTFMRGVAHGAHATLDCKFSTFVVLDDDKRLLAWDARTVECDANTVLLGQDIKCAPNTVVNAMRTQLLDFLFLHDRRHFGREAEGNGPPLRAKPFDSPFDQYFDLSTSRFDHLERPFLLDQGPPGDEDSSEAAFIARCRSKILRGDPLSGRDAVPVFEGPSTQRGGLMVVSNPDFLQLQQSSPRIRVTSGSDTLFCEVHVRPQVTCLVKRRLAVLHCSSNNTVSSPEQLRLLEVQEVLGAMVCRRPGDRPAFVSDRLLSLRIRGIVETLRKRPGSPVCGAARLPERAR